MVYDACRRNERVLFTVHKSDVVAQQRARFEAAGCPMRQITVTSIQSLLEVEQHETYDLVVFDEAHHGCASEWQAALERAGAGARMLGLTATPQRGDGKPLGDVFDELVEVVTYGELIEGGWVVPCEVLSAPFVLENALAISPIDAYQRHAPGTSALVFERDIAAARASCAAFVEAGIAAELIIGTTPRDERDATLARFADGTTQVLVNVYVLTEGIDLPHAQTVILARSCEHASTYVQIVGRVLRAAPGKREALLLDLVGASFLHGAPTAERAYSLTGRPLDELSGRRVPLATSCGQPGARTREDESDVDEDLSGRDEQGDGRRAALEVLGLDLVKFTVELRAKCTRPIGNTAAKSIDWDTQPLGGSYDSALASTLGVHVASVQKARDKRGVPAFGKRVTIDWDTEPLGKIPDAAIAQKHGVSCSCVLDARRKRGIPPYADDYWDKESRLGKIPDASLAKLLGVRLQAVRSARELRGIPVVGGRRVRSLDEWRNEKRLGKIRDRELANALGVSLHTVLNARQRLGIPSFQSQRRHG
jgi:hypothetical protein